LQLHETWECCQQPQRFLIFDRDAKFSADVVSTVKAMGSQPIRTAFRSPWQNGIAERWVGSVRRDLLDHVIVLNRKHLRRLLNDYVRYYHEDRTHLGLGKDTPVVELQRHPLRVATRLSLCRDSVVCITATQSRPKPSTAVN
jgi:transposase InsO family protein